jgi:hypothetical protein
MGQKRPAQHARNGERFHAAPSNDVQSRRRHSAVVLPENDPCSKQDALRVP